MRQPARDVAADRRVWHNRRRVGSGAYGIVYSVLLRNLHYQPPSEFFFVTDGRERKMSDITASLIVPVWNTAQHLPGSIESFLNQTLASYEIILVDDASTDVSPDICRDYQTRFPEKVRYIRLAQKISPGAARNAGLAHARGTFVGFADSDDRIAPTMLERMVTAAEQACADMSVCGFTIITPGKSREIMPPELMTVGMLMKEKHLLPSSCNKVYRRKYLLKHALIFADSYLGEDLAFVAKCLLTGPAVTSVMAPLYFYHKRTESLSHTMAYRRWILESLGDIRSFMKKHTAGKAERMFYKKLFWLHAVYNPACLLFIDSMLKGNNRGRNIQEAPSYLSAFARYLLP